MSLLINSGTTTTCKLHMLAWQRSEKHRNTTFCNFGSNFHHFTPFSTTGPHNEQLYAKYHFVGHVGRHIKLKMCSEMVKKGQKVQNVLYQWFL